MKVARDIKDICGISVTEERANKDPIKLLGAFMEQLGLKLKGEQRRNGDKRERVYRFGGTAKVNVYQRGCDKRIEEPEGLRDQVFTQWEMRDTEALAKWEAEMACAASGLAVTRLSDPLENVTAPSKNRDIESPVTTSSAHPIEKLWGVARELAEVAFWVAEGMADSAKTCLHHVLNRHGRSPVMEALSSLSAEQRVALSSLGQAI